jgi:hypothetical protein
MVAYKGVFIYFLRYSATGCTNQELRYLKVLSSIPSVSNINLAAIGSRETLKSGVAIVANFGNYSFSTMYVQ